MGEESELLRYDRTGRVLTVTLNRPEKLNALNREMHEGLMELFRDIDRDPECDVLVLTGEGRAFCVGGDVGKMPGAEAGKPDGKRQPLYLVARPLIESLLRVEKPVLAAVNGIASGLGTTIALFCDVVVAADTAHFTDSHVSLGLVAGDGGTVIWPMLVGVARAKELLMLGQRVPAEEAARLGLVNHVVPAAELESFSMGIATRLADQPAFAVKATKASINRLLLRTFQDVMDASGAWQLISLASQEHREAVKAFSERRAKRSAS